MRAPASNLKKLLIRSCLAWSAILVGILGCTSDLAAASVSTNIQNLQPDEAELRQYANGAGPTAIFRYGVSNQTGDDVFGVVDPVLWRIQFFTLQKWTAGGKSLAARLNKRGDCRLPPSFRTWRVHEFSDRILLQSQPQVTEDSLNKPKLFEHTK